MSEFLRRLSVELPIFQAPMAGVSTPEMAAAVSNAGALGAISVGALSPDEAREMIRAVRARTAKPFNVNVFCHTRPTRDAAREALWLGRLEPEFARFGGSPPSELREIYRAFVDDDEMLALLLEERPALVSFHFGVPDAQRVHALRDAGIALLGSATNLDEATALARAGIDAIAAQGYEAGGHRGIFDVEAPDDQLTTLALTRILVRELHLPVIAAGGIMDGAGIAAVLRLGASAAQLGTAFIDTEESLADAAYRAALRGPNARHTRMTRAISGRMARCLPNRFTAIPGAEAPSYPLAYHAGKALHALAKVHGESGYGAQWAGQGAPLLRPRVLPAAELVRLLAEELAREQPR